MERDNPNVTQPAADPVDETLERLEVADTLEDLRHHIDDLIARLSEQEQATVPASNPTLPGELEGQLENLGGKVESASYLLAELADLLESQTERIETIEQQLGDPDFSIGQSPALAQEDVPRFTMRPAQEAQGGPPTEPQTRSVSGAQGRRATSLGEPETQTEAMEAIRRYLETRFERIETAIRDVDKRIVEMRTAADERERYVRELEERLLLLVEIAAARPTPENDAEAEEIRTGEHRRGEGREAGELDLVRYLPPRPSHMPVFAHDAARARRKLVRRAGFISPPTVPALGRGLRATAEAEMPPVVSFMREVRTDSPGVASYVTSGRVPGVELRAEPVASFAERDSTTEARVEPSRSALRNGSASATRAVSAGSSALSREQNEGTVVPSGVRELEKLVERDVSLRRDFRAKPGDSVRPAKAHPTVMVVDDAPDALTVLSIYLSKTGYQVVTATSAEDCLAKLRHHAIDAIVLDAKLSGASGEHVCRVLREDPAYAHRRDVPVIVYTGYPDDFPAEVRDEWKADDYVVKGGDMLPLMRALVRHTSRDATT